jgi:hypothetical protein
VIRALLKDLLKTRRVRVNSRTNKKVLCAGRLDSYTHNSITMKLDHRRIPISFALPPRNTSLEALEDLGCDIYASYVRQKIGHWFEKLGAATSPRM